MTPKKKLFPEVKVTNFDEPCVVSIHCFLLASNKKQRKEWVKNRDFYLVPTTRGDRVMTLVTIKGYHNKTAYFMDVITGSLYDPTTRRCLSSMQLEIKKSKKKLSPNPELKETLLNLTNKE